MAESDAGAGDAFAAGFGALRADGTLFAAFELSITSQPIILVRLYLCLSVASLGTAYLPLAAGEAVSQRKVSRFLVSTAHLTTTYHPVLDRGAIAALTHPLYTIKRDTSFGWWT